MVEFLSEQQEVSFCDYVEVHYWSFSKEVAKCSVIIHTISIIFKRISPRFNTLNKENCFNSSKECKTEG
jgi:hypothetical protein